MSFRKLDTFEKHQVKNKAENAHAFSVSFVRKFDLIGSPEILENSNEAKKTSRFFCVLIYYICMKSVGKYKNIRKFREFIRFCLVGVCATAIHYLTYLLLIKCNAVEGRLWANIAYSIGYLTGFIFNLLLSAYYTFKTELTLQRSMGFLVTNLINYGLHIVFLNLYILISIPEQWAPLPTYLCVVPINFILVKTVFKKLQ